MKSSRPRHPVFVFPAGLGMAMMLSAQEARADIYAPFVWPVAFSAVVLLPIISLAEGLLLWRLHRLTVWRALKVSFLVNVASTFLGVLLSVLSLPVPVPLLDLTLVLVFFAGTVWFEAWLLARLVRTIQRPYRLSFRMNAVSYAILLALAGYLAHRQYSEKQMMRIPADFSATSSINVVSHPDGDAGDETSLAHP